MLQTTTQSTDKAQEADMLLSLTAHELKTPITTLKLLTQLHILQHQKRGRCLLRADELEVVDRQLDRLTRLVNDLLDVSLIQNQTFTLKLAPVNITSLIGEVVQSIEPMVQTRNLVFTSGRKAICSSTGHTKCHHKLTEPKVLVRADADRIKQVLINLLMNAIAHSPTHSTIVITMTTYRNRVVVTLTDHGPGIAKKEQVHVFEPYYRGKGSTHKGYGLGLYIAKAIVAQHDGHMWVQSQIGKGSTFSFSLPRY